MRKENEYVEEIKREWRKCASFIRHTYSFAYPKFFDEHFESDIDKHLKDNIARRGQFWELNARKRQRREAV